MKTMKRVLTTAMAGAMALSMALPAFAADPVKLEDSNVPEYAAEGESNTKTTITGKFEETAIDVIVPTTGAAILNPYGMGITVVSNNVTYQMTGQIATAPMAIKNKSNLDLSVGATAVATLGTKSTMKLVERYTGEIEAVEADAENGIEAVEAQDALTDKSAHVVLQLVTAPDAVVGDDAAVTPLIFSKGILDATWDNAAELAVTKTSKTLPEDDQISLKAATFETNGTFKAYPKQSIGLFRLTGDCVKAPKVAWDKTDTFTVNVAFTFSPDI